jgi:hypothetical protein
MEDVGVEAYLEMEFDQASLDMASFSMCRVLENKGCSGVAGNADCAFVAVAFTQSYVDTQSVSRKSAERSVL